MSKVADRRTKIHKKRRWFYTEFFFFFSWLEWLRKMNPPHLCVNSILLIHWRINVFHPCSVRCFFAVAIVVQILQIFFKKGSELMLCYYGKEAQEKLFWCSANFEKFLFKGSFKIIVSGTVYITFSRISPTNAYKPKRSHYVKTDILVLFSAVGFFFFRNRNVILQPYTVLNNVLNARFSEQYRQFLSEILVAGNILPTWNKLR